MNLKEVKELVEFYEDRIVNQFEEHFSNLVLEDFYSGGCDVGRIEDEFFYEEYFSRYEGGIIDLLNEIDFDDEEYYDFQLRLIKLKRIIDTKLSKVKLDNDDSSNVNRVSRTSTFIINPKLDKVGFIKNLYDSLIKYHFISNNEDEFNLLFESNINPTKRIHWKGTELQITTLISKLIDLKLFDIELNNYKFKLISTFFINKSGRDFRSKQLGSVYAEKKDSLPEDDSIFSIIEEMSTNI